MAQFQRQTTVGQSPIEEVQLNEYQLRQFTRVDFSPDEFDKIIYQKGARIIWEQAILCACIDENSQQADYNCPNCHGKAFRYFNPTEIRGAVTSLNRTDESQSAGMVDVGTAFLTTRASDNVSFRDRLTFVDFTTKYSQVLTVRDQKLRLKYDAQQIDRVMSTARAFEQEVDFTVNADYSEITFNPDIVEDGTRISVLMTVRPSYIVIDMPHELRGTFINFGVPEERWVVLPKQLMLKREDLIPLKRGDLY